MKLTSKGVVPYSAAEKEAFALLSRKPQTTSLLVERLGKEELFAPNSLIGVLGTLARKVRINEEPFRVMKSQRRGPHPIEHWIEKRSKK